MDWVFVSTPHLYIKALMPSVAVFIIVIFTNKYTFVQKDVLRWANYFSYNF